MPARKPASSSSSSSSPWHSRGYLPHFDQSGLVQALTFRREQWRWSSAWERRNKRSKKCQHPCRPSFGSWYCSCEGEHHGRRSSMTSLWTRAGLTWRQFGLRLLRQIWEDEVLGRCAELAYVFLFSVFPLLLFLTTLLGYLAEASPGLRLILFNYLAQISPSREVTALLFDTLQEISAARTGWQLYLSLILAVWVASNGMIAVSRTLNTACGLKETRRWWRRRLIAIVLTLTFSVLIISALGMMFYGSTLGEAIAERLGVAPIFAVAWQFLQWPLVLIFVLISF